MKNLVKVVTPESSEPGNMFPADVTSNSEIVFMLNDESVDDPDKTNDPDKTIDSDRSKHMSGSSDDTLTESPSRSVSPSANGRDTTSGRQKLEVRPSVSLTHYVDRDKLYGSFNDYHNFPELGLGNLTDLENAFLTHSFDGLKTFIRTNSWPPDHVVRKRLWMRLIEHMNNGADVSESSYIYKETIRDIFHNRSDDISSIHQRLPSYVDPAFLMNYSLNEQGRLAAKKIICVIGHLCPDVTYGPKIYPMTCLFLHYMTEEEAYNSMITLLKAKHGRRITQTKLAYESSKLTLISLLKKLANASYKYLLKVCKGNTNTLSTALDGWLLWIYRDLPMEYLVRVIDVYLCEGTKILYRVAIGLLMFYSKQGKRHSGHFEDETGRELHEAISAFCQNIRIPVDKLLKTSFGIRGLRRKEINRMLLRNEMFIRSEQNIADITSGGGMHGHQRRSSLDLNMKVSPSYDRLAANTAGHLTGQMIYQRSHSAGFLVLNYVKSLVVTSEQLHLVWHWLPARMTIFEPELIFTTEEHGTSITTFFDKVDGHEPTLILIKTATNEIFGAYCSTDWDDRHRHDPRTYFGTGESFIFTVWPKSEKYAWVGLTTGEMGHGCSMFMSADHSMITMGGGRGQGIYFGELLDHGRTEGCDTFGNPPLCTGSDFCTKVVEVYKFV